MALAGSFVARCLGAGAGRVRMWSRQWHDTDGFTVPPVANLSEAALYSLNRREVKSGRVELVESAGCWTRMTFNAQNSVCLQVNGHEHSKVGFGHFRTEAAILYRKCPPCDNIIATTELFTDTRNACAGCLSSFEASRMEQPQPEP